MLYFRSKKFPIESKERTKQLLDRSTSKVLTFFDLTDTNTYVIPKERSFAGQRLDSGKVLISRYRHAFLKIVPRLITKWEIESVNGQLFLATRTRLGLVPFIGLLIMSFSILVHLIKSLINFELPDTNILMPMIFLVVFALLTKYELAATDKTIKMVIKQ